MRIDERTPVSIGLMVLIIGGVFWLASMHIETVSNAEQVKELKEDVKDLQKIKTDIEVIKNDLKRVLNKTGG